jgi:hypothetical protein
MNKQGDKGHNTRERYYKLHEIPLRWYSHVGTMQNQTTEIPTVTMEGTMKR